MSELLSAIVRLSGIRKDFDEYYWVQFHTNGIRFKLRYVSLIATMPIVRISTRNRHADASIYAA
jgi:hypothetical protein